MKSIENISHDESNNQDLLNLSCVNFLNFVWHWYYFNNVT